MRTIVVMLVATAIPAAAWTQDAPAASYDGTWAVSGTSRDGYALNAELVLKGDLGTWRAYARSGTAAKNNPCLLKTFTVTIQKSTVDALKFHVNGASQIAGCPDFSATLRPTASGALDGGTGAGTVIHLERK